MNEADQRQRTQGSDLFESVYGPPDKGWSLIAEKDPDFFAAFGALAGASLKMGGLTPKMREFVRIAMAASTSHLCEPALRNHIRRARGLGASLEEIIEIVELSSGLGVHSMMLGLPTLLDVMSEMDISPVDAPTTTSRQEDLKAKWIAERGFWHPLLDDMQRVVPAFFEALIDYSVAPVKSGRLSPKLRELIYIAIDASTTHLHAEGTRLHIANALRSGATPCEILEVLAIVSTQGADTISLGASIIAEEFGEALG